MRKFFVPLVLMFALVLAGCGNSANKVVVGEWKADASTLKMHYKDASKDKMLQEGMKLDPKAATKDFADWTMSFKGDSTCELKHGGQGGSATYNVSGSNVSLHDPSAPAGTDMNFTIGPDQKTLTMHMTTTEMTMEMNFVKA